MTLQPGSTFTIADMPGLRVSELAARAGVPPSTVRFYERAGLLRSARRAVNGYRLFDESAVADLALIGRAKDAGMSLDDAAEVAGAWRDGSCRALAGRLRAHLTAELSRTGERAADLAARRRKLEAMLGRLPAGERARDAGAAEPEAVADRCGPGCGCEGVLGAGAPAAGEAGAAPGCSLDGCSLDEAGLTDRLGQWRALASAAQSTERDGDTVRLTLAPAAIPSAAALMAAEASCCPQGRFTLEVTAGRASLTAEIPGIADALLAGPCTR